MPSIFKNGNFIRYYIADSFGKLADNFFFIYILWVALQYTGSPAYAGALLMTNAIPRLLFMVFGGTLADRIAPQVILRTGNIIQAVGLGVILLWITTDSLSLHGLFIIAGVFGLVDAFASPASMSAIPRIIPKRLLLRANSLIQGGEMLIFMLGSLLAGVILQLNNLEVATMVNLGLYGFATIMFFTVRMKFHAERIKKESELKLILDGLKYAWKKPVVRANIMLLAATNLAVSGPVSIGLLLLVTDKFGLSPLYYSYTGIAFGVGIMAGAIITGVIKSVRRPGWIIIGSYLLTGVGFIGMALSSDIWTLLVLSAVIGIFSGVGGTVNNTWVQSTTRMSMLGRVSSLMVIAALAFDPFSQGMSGILAEWSLDGMFIIAGVFLILATLAVLPFNKILIDKKSLTLDKSTKM